MLFWVHAREEAEVFLYSLQGGEGGEAELLAQYLVSQMFPLAWMLLMVKEETY